MAMGAVTCPARPLASALRNLFGQAFGIEVFTGSHINGSPPRVRQH